MKAPSELVRKELERILEWPPFRRAPRLSLFLRFIVEETLENRELEIKEYTVGTEVYGRPLDFEPRLDPTVRVEARKLRARLNDYYMNVGDKDSVRINLGKGSYIPHFSIIHVAPETTNELCASANSRLAERTQDALAKAHSCFWQAIVDTPRSPAGYLGLAAYNAVALAMEMVSPQDALPGLRMALAEHDRLNPARPESDVLRAILAYAEKGSPRPPLAEAESAVRKHPRTGAAHFWYGAVLSACERHAEALDHMNQAALLTSYSPLHQAHVSWILYHAGEYRKALDILAETEVQRRDFTVGYLRARILAELGKFDDAAEALPPVVESGHRSLVLGCLAYIHCCAGNRTQAECFLDQLTSRGMTEYVSLLRIAIVQEKLGFSEDASRSIECAQRQNSYSLIWRAVDPQLSGLR